MHNSKDRQPMRYDGNETGSVRLLRAATATELCLACHRSDRRGVEVSPPSNWDPPGGGFPQALEDPLNQAHSLGAGPLQPPEGDTPVAMTCITCHDPHGNGAYRNLRASPSGTGRSTSAPIVRQTVTASGGNAEEVYTRANVRYVSGMSQWCMDCHNLMDPTSTSHTCTWDQPIAAPAGVETWAASFAAWSAVTENRVPSENASGLPSPDVGDKVFCLSCHKAHGSPNDAAVIHADGSEPNSTCQQCHGQ